MRIVKAGSTKNLSNSIYSILSNQNDPFENENANLLQKPDEDDIYDDQQHQIF
jgi:hypothetical protein